MRSSVCMIVLPPDHVFEENMTFYINFDGVDLAMNQLKEHNSGHLKQVNNIIIMATVFIQAFIM